MERKARLDAFRPVLRPRWPSQARVFRGRAEVWRAPLRHDRIRSQRRTAHRSLRLGRRRPTMILKRLYELAKRENLLADPAFEELPIPFVIELGDCGQFLGVSVQRGESVVPSKKKGGEAKIKRDSGRRISVPR